MIRPPFLQKGDLIAILAPARKVSASDIKNAINVFETWGLRVKLAGNLYSNKHSYLAGNDNERLLDFQQNIDDPEVKAIIAARGGYGSTRILDQIDFSSALKFPKWIVGFSDITAIHLNLYKLGLMSVHGIMPILFDQHDAMSSIESLRSLLFGSAPVINALPSDFNRLGHSTGTVVGGNLSLLVDSLGTRSELNSENKILVIEEIDEYFYRLDRMLTQLRRAGKLNKLNGLIVGHMTDIKNSTLSFGETVEEIVMQAVREYSFPVAFNFPSGHANPNLAWIHGGQGTLVVNHTGSLLSFDEIYRK